MDVKENDIAGAVTFIRVHLHQQGIETRQHHDFRQFNKCMKKLQGKGCSGQFSVKKNSLRPNNAFWLEWLHDDKTIAVHALRYDDYGDTDLASIWNDGQQEHVYGGGKIGADHPAIVSRMKGKIVYAGDYFLDPEFRGDRLPTSMALYSFFLAEMAWKPDWIYGFMNSDLVTQKGFNSRVGYLISAPIGTDWIEPPKGINPMDWLVALDRDAINQNARVIAKLGLGAMMRKR